MAQDSVYPQDTLYQVPPGATIEVTVNAISGSDDLKSYTVTSGTNTPQNFEIDKDEKDALDIVTSLRAPLNAGDKTDLIITVTAADGGAATIKTLFYG
ncbi:MAG: hypothetical protein HC896_18920 [Bacteroidales bacterium]|nr:hypothetical protein [Bacteroidales bacterium]